MTKQKKKAVSKFTRSFVTSGIPHGWSLVTAGSLLTDTEYGLSEPGDIEGDTPIVGMKNIGDGKVVLSNLSTINSDGADLSKMTLHKGDILLNRTNSPDLVGKVGIVREDSDAVFASYLVRLNTDPERVDAEYLNAWLNGEIAQRAIKRISTRAVSQANVNPTEFQKYCPVLLPDTEKEQTKIASVLQTWDEAIDKLVSIRGKKFLRSLWFRTEVLSGKRRFPRFNKPWKTVQLSQILREHGTNSSGTEEVFSVSVHKGLINQVEHLGRSFAAADTSNYNLVFPGDIVYTKSPTGEFPLGIIKQSKVTINVLVSPLYGVFTPATQALGVILDAYFESPVTVMNYLHPLVQKGAKNTIAITNKRFLEGHFTLPTDAKEQEQIAAMLKASAQEISGIEDEIESLQRQKRGLMQKLLTGEWRVKL